MSFIVGTLMASFFSYLIIKIIIVFPMFGSWVKTIKCVVNVYHVLLVFEVITPKVIVLETWNL